MSILGVIVRAKEAAIAGIEERLRALPGVELAQPALPGDGRLVVVIEDVPGGSAAATLGAIALWPDVLSAALVYEYSGPDAPAPEAVGDFTDWRRSLVAGDPSAEPH